MPNKRALILINPMARQGEADGAPLRQVFNDGSMDIMLHFITETSRIETLIREYRREVDCIVVGGGDGTLEKAAQIIIQGRIRYLDLGWVNGKHFLNVASLGLAVRLTHSLSRNFKKKWGILAYPLALLRVYRTQRPFRASVTCDGKKQYMKSIQIAIGNGRHYGGGMTISHDAGLEDQLLHFYSLKPEGAWRHIKAARSIINGTFEPNDPVLLMNGKEIKVVTHRKMLVDTDGELSTCTPAVFRVKSSILPVFVP